MAKSRHIQPRLPPIELGDALLGVIRTRGAAIFSAHVHEGARAAKQAPSLAAQWSAEAWKQAGLLYQEAQRLGIRKATHRSLSLAREQATEGIQFLTALPGRMRGNVADVVAAYQQLPTPQERTEFLVTWVLYVASFLGGVAMGLQAPRIDLALARGKLSRDRIILHSFPLLAVNLATRWLGDILEETSHVPGLSATDLRRLHSLSKVVSNLSGGIRAGAAARNWGKHLRFKVRPSIQKNVVVDSQAYRLAEAFVVSLRNEGGKSR